MKIFHKLVRDRVPEIIVEKGQKPHTRILSERKFKESLGVKLREEVEEFQRAKTAKDKKEELADILEVLDAIMRAYNFPSIEIQRIQKEKRAKRGGFEKRVFLEGIE